MNKDTYHEWLAGKRQVHAPANLADSVLAALTPARPAWKTSDFWAKAALITLAVGGGIGRYAIALFLILFSN